MSDSTTYNLLRGTTGKVYSATLPSNAIYKNLVEFVLDAPHASGDAFTLSFDVRLSAPGSLYAYLYNPKGNTYKSVYVNDGSTYMAGRMIDGYAKYEAGPEWRHVAITWEYVEAPVQPVDHIIIARMFGSETAVGTTVEVRNIMLVRGDTPRAWAPAEGETLAGGGAQMSANLWKAENVFSAEALEDGIYACSGTRGVRTNVALDRLATNQTFHCGFSVNPGKDDKFNMTLWYRDAAGYINYAFTPNVSVTAGKWTRVSGSVVVPSGMTVYQMVICNDRNASGTSGWKVTNPTLSLGSPVTLASGAHTPYATQDHVSVTYATKSQLKVTDTELSGKVSDALTTAKAYTDSSIETEVTNRNAAIKAQADSISLSVSKTYAKYETFSAYQTDADGRIATANSNASTAVSTAKTAASDAATAKTNASTAVTTANSASTSAANAVKTANAASSSAASAKSVADSASSTAKAASTTASKASTDASEAVKTANTASSNASSAVKTANGAVTTANSASTSAANAVKTANAASSSAASAKSVADSASSTAKAASTSASNAVSAANSANSKSDSAVSTANTAKSTADTAKSTADAVNRAAVKTYPYPNSLGVSNWVHLGDWSNTQDSHTLKIDLLSGDGYNAGTTQNSTVEIFVKDAHQSTASATYAYGATVTLGQLDRSKCHVDVIATSATACSIWVKLDFVYDAGSYTVAMTPGDSWTHSGAVSSTEPTGTKQNVAFLTNAEEANAAAGAAQTSANNAQKAADKAQSSADDTAAALAKAAVRIRIDGTPMADGTSQLMAHVYVGNDEVSANAIAKLGTLVWKMDGVADRRGTTTYTAQTGKFVTCRLEA